jgi:hypothetical protein
VAVGAGVECVQGRKGRVVLMTSRALMYSKLYAMEMSGMLFPRHHAWWYLSFS